MTTIDWEQRALAAEEELQEYQQTSAEFEAELERELQEKERELQQWRTKFEQLQFESSNTIQRQSTSATENNAKIERQTAKIDTLEKTASEQSTKLRKYEQEIDDLQRLERQAAATNSDLEAKLTTQLERNAFLEADLEERQRVLEAECQRLRDENRDLGLDLEVHKRQAAAVNSLVPEKSSRPTTPRQINFTPDFQENFQQTPTRYTSPIPAGPLSTNTHNYSSTSSSPDCIKNSSTTTTVTSENSVAAGSKQYHDYRSPTEAKQANLKPANRPMFLSKIFTSLKRSTSFKRSKSRINK